jgi:hypothetical protein
MTRLSGLAGVSAVTATVTLLAVQPVSFGRGAPTLFLVVVGGWLFMRGVFLAGAGLFAAADDDRGWRLWLVPVQVVLGFGALYAAIWRLDPGSLVGAGLEPPLWRFSLFAATLGGAGDVAPEGVVANAAVIAEMAVAALAAGALVRRLHRPTGWIVGAVAVVLAAGIVLSLGEERRYRPGFERGIAGGDIRGARDLAADSVTLRSPAAARRAREAGMTVTLRPRVPMRRLPGFAGRAQRAGADRLVMDGPADATRRWRRTIAAVRRRFDGSLTYAARWDHVDDVGFWDELDVIGVDGPRPLPDDEHAWTELVDDVDDVHARHGKDVLLTEIGYADAGEDAVEAALVVWAEPDWAAGMSWREDSATGSAGERIREWYSE